MKIWVDDIRDAPDGYFHCHSVNSAIRVIEYNEEASTRSIHGARGIELIDLDHDAGDYAKDGGDYINLLKWMEESGRSYPVRIHSMNPVGVENMRRIIERNGWRELR